VPDMLEHAREIYRQIFASQDAVRNLTNHWATDGAHREELLRQIIRDRLPETCRVDSGFVVTPTTVSRQVDILITDRRRPVVQKSADGTAVVTPDAVLAMIEVKSRLEGPAAYAGALRQLAESAQLCPAAWTGLFVFECAANADFWDGPDDTILGALVETAMSVGVNVKCISVGPNLFVRHWSNSAAHAQGLHAGSAWHSYYMIDLAPAYFIGNLVAEVSEVPEEFETVWFPIPQGKEGSRRWYGGIDLPPRLFPDHEKTCRENGIHRVLRRAGLATD
jgi:hypothetical protein